MFHPHPNKERIQQLFDRQLAIEYEIQNAINAIQRARAKKNRMVRMGERAHFEEKVISHYSMEKDTLEKERLENNLKLKQMDKEMLNDTFDLTIGEYLRLYKQQAA